MEKDVPMVKCFIVAWYFKLIRDFQNAQIFFVIINLDVFLMNSFVMDIIIVQTEVMKESAVIEFISSLIFFNYDLYSFPTFLSDWRVQVSK